MNIQEIIDIIDIDIKNINNIKKIVRVNLEYIEDIKNKDFETNSPRFSILSNKFLETINYHFGDCHPKILTPKTPLYKNYKDIEDLSKQLDETINEPSLIYDTKLLMKAAFVPSRNKEEKKIKYIKVCKHLSNLLDEEILSAYSKINSIDAYNFKFYELYTSNNVDKLEAESLISQAINIILEDNILSSEAKEIIVKHLKKALQSLEQGDNSAFFGTTKEIIIVLGAIGSIASGCVGVAQLAQAKVENAVNIVEKTSVTNQYLLPNEKLPFIECNAILGENYSDKNILPPVNFEDRND